ncbi:hypothetical protein QBC34DRAFT_410290 [Podospora aff. communis PSN243]|uniref:Secreted protein n=1 Tax=Podospora aff. communis PSN243 TaxID=3040156 RepID=A0AAV9GFX8_9PEZI|nr:hypothetical protein QBC34DRAFT_410290 [Podospora aff. communis PSN243]
MFEFFFPLVISISPLLAVCVLTEPGRVLFSLSGSETPFALASTSKHCIFFLSSCLLWERHAAPGGPSRGPGGVEKSHDFYSWPQPPDKKMGRIRVVCEPGKSSVAELPSAELTSLLSIDR